MCVNQDQPSVIFYYTLKPLAKLDLDCLNIELTGLSNFEVTKVLKHY